MATQIDLQLSQCLKTLRTVRNVLRMAYSTGAISETLWAGEGETLLDRIEAQISSVESNAAPKAGRLS